jgi:hypothetical protein
VAVLAAMALLWLVGGSHSGGVLAQTGPAPLQFPVRNVTAHTAPISSVFDHSMTKPYASKDGIVVAFTGARGERRYGPSVLTAAARNGEVALSWSPATIGATEYRLLARDGAYPAENLCAAATFPANTQLIYKGLDTSFTHSGLINGHSYRYRLCIQDAAGVNRLGIVAAVPSVTPKTAAGTNSCDTLRQADGRPFNFGAAGRYVGAGSCGGAGYLSYDNHPGIDYAFGYGTPLYPVVSGRVSYQIAPSGTSSAADYHTLSIDPEDGSGYRYFYLHLSTWRDGFGNLWKTAANGTTVTACGDCPQDGDWVDMNRSQPIALTGNFQKTWGGVAAHLHFEATKKGVPVDPYGTFPGDPYSPVSVNLWDAVSPVPSAPGQLTLTAIGECAGQTSQIRLSWTASAGATTYDIYRDNQLYVSGRTSTVYVNTVVTAGLLYTYRIRAVNAAGATDSNGDVAAAPTSCAGIPAAITAPMPGSTLPSASATFSWTPGANVDLYDLNVGSVQGGRDLYDMQDGTNLSVTTPPLLPSDGQTLYVTLWSRMHGVWYYTFYEYRAASIAGKASILSPSNGSSLAASAVTFAWRAALNGSWYDLYVGSSRGMNDLYPGGQTTSLSTSVAGLPGDGRTLFVRLWSWMSGAWVFNDYTYTAAMFALGPSWDFDAPGNFQGWTVVNGYAEVNGGALNIDPGAGDYSLIGPAISVSASAFTAIRIRLASNAADPVGKIYFRTAAENFSEGKAVTFAVNSCSLCGTAPYVEYVVPMGGNPGWIGTITGIRVDPSESGTAGTNRDAIGIDYIRIVP